MKKYCVSCSLLFIPSSRHKKCPKCRHKDKKSLYSKKCNKNCGQSINSWHTTCKACSVRYGVENPMWKGGKFINSNGYIMLLEKGHPRANNSGYVLEHIIVMEKHLGRLLLPGENIHHINGVKSDNRIENLELWIRPQPTGIRAKDAVKWAKKILEDYKQLSGEAASR